MVRLKIRSVRVTRAASRAGTEMAPRCTPSNRNDVTIHTECAIRIRDGVNLLYNENNNLCSNTIAHYSFALAHS